MTKRAFIFLLILLPACFLAAQTNNNTDRYQLLWEISGKGMKQPSYLFGTMHLTDSEVFNLPDSAVIAFNSVEAFAMEVHPDSITQFMLGNMDILRNSGFVFSDHLDYGQYRDLQKQVREVTGIDGLQLDDYDINILRGLIQNNMSDGDESTILDMHFYRMSQMQGKSGYSLEPIEAQMSALTDLSYLKDLQSIKEYLGLSDNYSGMMDSLRQLYLTGDIEEIDRWMIQEADSAFLNNLLYNRNGLMAENMQKIMQQETAFFAVGAAHLPGDKGIIELLRKAGYKLRPVKATYTGLVDDFKYVADTSIGWTAFEIPELGYQMDFPGKPTFVDNLHGQEMEGYMYIDLRDMTTYFTMMMELPLSIDSSNFSTFRDAMLQGMAGQLGVEGDLDMTEITRDGLPGMNVLMPIGEMSAFTDIVFNGKMLIMNMVGREKGTIPMELAQRYLRSFKLVEATPKPVNIFDHKEGAFQVIMPKDPEYTYLQMETESGKIVTGHLYVNTDRATGSSYLMRYSDLPPGNFMDDPIGLIQSNFDEAQSNMSSTLMDTAWSVFDGQYPMLRFMNRDEYDKERIVGQLVIRGNRLYMIIEVGLSEDLQDYDDSEMLKSFKLTDYAPVTWETYTDTFRGFEIQSPGEMNQINAVTFGNAIDSSFTFVCQDTLSGYSLNVMVRDYASYYSAPSYDSIMALHAEDVKMSADSLYAFSMHQEDGLPVVTATMKTESDVLLYHKAFVRGGSIYEAYVASTEDTWETGRFTQALESFKYIGTKPNDVLTQDRKPQLWEDLRSDYMEVQDKALLALTYLKFEEQDVPELIKAGLDPEFKKMEEDRRDAIYDYVFDAMVEMEDSSAARQLIAVKDSFNAGHPAFTHYLWALSEMNTLGTFPTLIEKLQPVTPADSLNWYGVLQPLTREADVDHEAILTELIPLMRTKDGRMGVLYVLYQLGYREHMSRSDFEPYMDVIVKAFGQLVTEDMNDPDIHYSVYYIFRLAEFVPKNAAFDQILQDVEVERSKDFTWLVYRKVAAQIERNLKLSKDDIKLLGESDLRRIDILQLLKKAGQLKLMSKKYLKPELLAWSDLYNVIYEHYDGDMPDYVDDMKLQSVEDFEFEGKKQQVFVYKFKVDGYKESFIAIAGPYPSMDAEDFDYADFTAVSFVSYYTMSLQSHITRIINNALEGE